jgi:uncharacterized protein (DUF1501 family)
MLQPDRNLGTLSGSTVSRRAFLGTTALTMLGLTLPEQAAANSATPALNCILLVLVGGPSQIDTWDPKPDAPAEIRGPFRPIATSVPGTYLSELFPRMASQAHRFALVRSVHHTAPAVHAAGYQLLQTGQLFGTGIESPHLGSVLHYLRGARDGVPSHVVLPGPIGNTGSHWSAGQSAGHLGAAFAPTFGVSPFASRLDDEPAALRAAYGPSRFGQDCFQARQLIERGVRFVTVNMFQTVYEQPTWDIHGSHPFSDLTDLAHVVAPSFDHAYSALLEDLRQRGLLETTVVAALGEFGRTPRINPLGGRDHHPGVWTILLAGGPIQGGQVIGASDASGTVPDCRPVTPGEVLATLYHCLGIDPHTRIPGPGGSSIPLVHPETQPIRELFC